MNRIMDQTTTEEDMSNLSAYEDTPADLEKFVYSDYLKIKGFNSTGAVFYCR